MRVRMMPRCCERATTIQPLALAMLYACALFVKCTMYHKHDTNAMNDRFGDLVSKNKYSQRAGHIANGQPNKHIGHKFLINLINGM